MSNNGNSFDKKPLQIHDRRDESIKTQSPIKAIEETNWTEDLLVWKWDKDGGWSPPEIRPYGPLAIMPSASVFQHATECFEGIKLFRGYDGQLRLLRVRKNCQRMLKSSLRIGLPGFALDDLELLITEFAA